VFIFDAGGRVRRIRILMIELFLVKGKTEYIDFKNEIKILL
jgi:hypothetical protein